MKTLSNALAKGTLATVAAAAMVASSASPALADARGYHDRGGISSGDVIAGALVIGGIAAVAAAAGGNDRDYLYDRAGYGDYAGGWGGGYNRDAYGRGNPRQAIEQCVFAAERSAGRYSYGRADVTDIRDVRSTRFGYEVRGRIAVNAQGRGWRSDDGQYGRGWNGDYRGWNAGLRGYDSGSFKCRIEQGRVVDMDFSGLRGL